MASSNQGGRGSGGQTPSSGRGWVSMDPERQREVALESARVVEDRTSAAGAWGAPGRSAASLAVKPAAGRRWAWPQLDGDDEGGSWRRYR